MTEAAHIAAVLDALTDGDAVPYTIQQAKRVQVLPPAYNEVTVERRYGDSYRSCGSTSRRGYRIAVRSLGRTIEGALEMRQAVEAALEDQRLTVDGLPTTPIRFETAQQVDDDEPGWFSGMSLWTYVR